MVTISNVEVKSFDVQDTNPHRLLSTPAANSETEEDTLTLCSFARSNHFPSGPAGGAYNAPPTPLTLCSVSDSDMYAVGIYKWTFLGVIFAGPFFILLFAYARIVHRLRGTRRVGTVPTYPVPTQCAVEQAARRLARNRRVVSMLVTVVILFFLAWTPILAFEAAGTIDGLVEASVAHLCTRYTLQFVACSNSCHNPIVYALLHDRLRRHLGRRVAGLKRCCRRRVHPGPSRAAPAVHLPTVSRGLRPLAVRSASMGSLPSIDPNGNKTARITPTSGNYGLCSLKPDYTEGFY
jgi:hypothetical protein